MRAIVLCAGAGSRLRPLTHILPKPLVPVGGVPMVVRRILALRAAGIREIVVNAAYGAAELVAALGDGARWDVRLHWSIEGRTAEEALETRGGIVRALDMLTDGGRERAFVAAAGDIVSDYPFERMLERAADADALAHLVLVPNPDYHPKGDMGIDASGRATRDPAVERYTYSSLGLFRAELFEGVGDERAALFPWLYGVIDAGRATAEVWRGAWYNVGSFDEVARLEAHLARMGEV